MVSGDIVIRLGPQGDPLGWAWVREGRGKPGRSTRPKPSELAAARRVIAVVPGQDVACHAVSLPVSNAAQARKALPFAMEDHLAEPVGAVHLALGAEAGGGTRWAGAVSHERMAGWLTMLEREGISADALVADHRCYRQKADGGALVEHLGGVSLIAGSRSATLDASMAAHIAAGYFASGDTDTVTTHADAAGLVALARERGWRQAPSPDPEADLATLAEGAVMEAETLNLLQGGYRRAQGWFDDWKVWRFAAAVWVVAGLAYAALLAGEASLLDARAGALREEARSIAREALPGTTRIVDPRRQMQAALAGRGAGETPEYLLFASAVLTAREAVPAIGIDGLRFSAPDRAMVLNLSYGDYDQFSTFRAALEGEGLAVDEGAARRSDGVMSGEVTLRWR